MWQVSPGSCRWFNPTARRGFLHVTGTDSLGTAVSLAHALSDATVIIGYAAGGILLGVLGVSGALWVNAATFLASGLLLTGVGRARSVEDGDERPVGLRRLGRPVRRPLAAGHRGTGHCVGGRGHQH